MLQGHPQRCSYNLDTFDTILTLNIYDTFHVFEGIFLYEHFPRIKEGIFFPRGCSAHDLGVNKIYIGKSLNWKSVIRIRSHRMNSYMYSGRYILLTGQPQQFLLKYLMSNIAKATLGNVRS